VGFSLFFARDFPIFRRLFGMLTPYVMETYKAFGGWLAIPIFTDSPQKYGAGRGEKFLPQLQGANRKKALRGVANMVIKLDFLP
jgi:hypothetical protein